MPDAKQDFSSLSRAYRSFMNRLSTVQKYNMPSISNTVADSSRQNRLPSTTLCYRHANNSNNAGCNDNHYEKLDTAHDLQGMFAGNMIVNMEVHDTFLLQKICNNQPTLAIIANVFKSRECVY